MTEMTPAEAVFFAAAALPAADRSAYLARACAGDDDLRRRVEAMLAARAEVGDFLEPVPSGPVPDSSMAASAPHQGTAAFDPDGSSGTRTADLPGRDEAVGAVLAGRYKLVEAIGEGGMGAVYLAQQTEPVKRLVAVKVIKAGMDSKAVLARFEAERQALALMDHPNIARVLDAGTTESGRPYFVMELVKGVPITQFCDDRKLTPRERLELFVPVCQAVQHAHQKGVIHRDLKPSNVLVALYDDRPVPKVIDFGVAKATGPQLTDLTLVTGLGAVVGTPEYMSPEQASLNNLDVDTRSDVYSLGVLLYELLTGSTPVDRKSLGKAALLEVLRVVREVEAPRPSTKLSTAEALPSISASRGTEPRRLTALLRGELDWIVLRALEKDRNRRYESANGFAADVQRYLAGEPVQAVPPTAGYRVRKWVRRNKVAVATAGVVATAMLAGTAATVWQAVRAESARAAEADERQKAEKAGTEAREQQRRAEELRKLAEHRAASATVDAALQGIRTREGLLRLAGTLRTLPPDAESLRQGVAINLLVWGQLVAPEYAPVPQLPHATRPDGRVGIVMDGGQWEARDLVTGRVLARLGGDAVGGSRVPFSFGHVTTFSDDGTLAATLHETPHGATVRLWDAVTWQERGRIRPTPGLTYEVRLNRDGSRLVTGSSRDADTRFIDGPKFHLWDTRTLNKVTELTLDEPNVPVLEFNPAGDVLLAGRGRAVRLWSATDGRLLHTLDKHTDEVLLAAFSPSGRWLAVAAGPRVYWWNVAEGTPGGPPMELGFRVWPSSGETTCRFAFEGDDVLIVREWDSERVNFGRLVGSAVCVRGEARPHSINAVASDGRFALTDDRLVYALAPLRRLNPPPGRRFPPEALAAANGRRFVQLDRHLFDLEAEVPVGSELLRPETRVVPVQVPGLTCAVEGDWEVSRSHGRVLVPSPTHLPPNDVLELWARVLSRGHIDPSTGLFKGDDEAEWERNRQELVKRAVPVGEFPFPGAFAADRLFWLRAAIKEEGDPEKQLPLMSRLVAAEPTWAHYRSRAALHERCRRDADAIRDDLHARKIGGKAFAESLRQQGGGAEGAVHNVLIHEGRPREEYELAMAWLEMARELVAAPGAPGRHYSERPENYALGLYHVGRYSDALKEVGRFERAAVVEVVGGLMSPITWAVVDGERIQTYRDMRHDPEPWAIEAMCHLRLGNAAAARASLQRARNGVRDRLLSDVQLRGGITDEALRAIEGHE